MQPAIETSMEINSSHEESSGSKIDLAQACNMRIELAVNESEHQLLSKSLPMPLNFQDRVCMSSGGFTSTGLFLPGLSRHPDKPLIVLIHGSGVNARYWDNDLYSLPKDFAGNGFDVLNIQRSGYGGEKCPATQTPILDTIPLYASLISLTYKDHCVAKNGIILIGSGVGSAISLAIAGEHAGPELPVVGVSACAYLPASKGDEEDALMGIKGLLLSDTGETVGEGGQKVTAMEQADVQMDGLGTHGVRPSEAEEALPLSKGKGKTMEMSIDYKDTAAITDQGTHNISSYWSPCCPDSLSFQKYPQGLQLTVTPEQSVDDLAHQSFQPIPEEIMHKLMVLQKAQTTVNADFKFDFLEAATKQELAEENDPIWEHRLKFEIAPRIKMPMQYLISPFDVLRKANKDAQAALAEAISWFANSASIDKDVLPMPTGPLYEVESGENRLLLQAKRERFCELVTAYGAKEIWWHGGLCMDLSGKTLWKAGESSNDEDMQ